MEGQKESSTLLIMLQVLKKYGVTDSMLQRKYNLNRASLNKARKGIYLPYAHESYFDALLSELEFQRQKYHNMMDEENHRKIKDVMFEVMLRQHQK